MCIVNSQSEECPWSLANVVINKDKNTSVQWTNMKQFLTPSGNIFFTNPLTNTMYSHCTCQVL